MNSFRSLLAPYYRNLRGWRTNRKIVVFESDDWGSIRMPSKDVYIALLKRGIRVDNCHYCRNDSLETGSDLSALFEVLDSVKGRNGNPAIITVNSVVANPDFEKIRSNNYQEYHYRLISDSYKVFNGCSDSFELLKEGNKKGLLSIQSHGREHLNIGRWMHYLRGGYPETKLAFEHGVYGLSATITSEMRKSFLPAFDFETNLEENKVNEIAIDGLRIFKDLFGYNSESFIAPNYVWSQSLECSISEKDVRFIQGTHVHTFSVPTGQKSSKRLRYFGKKNDFGQLDLVRNAYFEPSENPEKDWINSCLSEISSAFLWKHPVIICSHRVNFMGGLNEKNRDINLRLLKQLLSEIVKRWPDVEFMSSNQLGNLIQSDKK